MSKQSVLMVMAVLTAALTAPRPARAGDTPCKGEQCRPPKNICFNLYCEYEKDHDDHDHDHDGGYGKCQAAARFFKNVDWDGDEIEDRSDEGDNPAFEVQCDGDVIFNNSAHRFTDRTGTRLQAESGPFPAVLLPKGALQDWHSYLPSSLELNGQQLRGFCFIYTGAP